MNAAQFTDIQRGIVDQAWGPGYRAPWKEAKTSVRLAGLCAGYCPCVTPVRLRRRSRPLAA